MSALINGTETVDTVELVWPDGLPEVSDEEWAEQQAWVDAQPPIDFTPILRGEPTWTVEVRGQQLAVTTALAIEVLDAITAALPDHLPGGLKYDRPDAETGEALPVGVEGFAPTDHPGRTR